jgi:hypothetical protein
MNQARNFSSKLIGIPEKREQRNRGGGVLKKKMQESFPKQTPWSIRINIFKFPQITSRHHPEISGTARMKRS